MTLNALSIRPPTCLNSLTRTALTFQTQQRFVSAGRLRFRAPLPEPSRTNPWAPAPPKPRHKIKIIPAPPSIKKTCPEPLKTFNASQIALLDPSGARTRLFSDQNIDRACLGDILLVRFKNGDPFFGVYMARRRQGPDTAILLRNTVMRTGAEMWVKIYNPTVVGIEIVQRTERRARRSRLYYLRKPEHDRGDLSGILNAYLRTRRTLGMQRKDKKENEKVKLQKAAKAAAIASKQKAVGKTETKTATSQQATVKIDTPSSQEAS